MITPVATDLSALSRSALVELIEIDASSPDIGGGVLRFTNYQKTNGLAVSWKGQQYEPYPITLDDVEYIAKGVSNRPVMKVSNLSGAFTALCLQYSDLLNAKVVRRRVLDKYLDGAPNANTSAGLPEEVWYIERKLSEDFNEITFELSSPMDLDNVMIPFMRVNSSHCQVRSYRGAECSYSDTRFYKADGAQLTANTDRGVYDSNSNYVVGNYFYVMRHQGQSRLYYVCVKNALAGTPLSNREYFQPDICGRRLTDCITRFGNTAQLPFLAFPGTTKLPQ